MGEGETAPQRSMECGGTLLTFMTEALMTGRSRGLL